MQSGVTRTVVLYVRVPNEVKTALDDLAERHRVSLTAVVGRALGFYLESKCGWTPAEVGQLP
jgi:hypothetical protein